MSFKPFRWSKWDLIVIPEHILVYSITTAYESKQLQGKRNVGPKYIKASKHK